MPKELSVDFKAGYTVKQTDSIEITFLLIFLRFIPWDIPAASLFPEEVPEWGIMNDTK